MHRDRPTIAILAPLARYVHRGRRWLSLLHADDPKPARRFTPARRAALLVVPVLMVAAVASSTAQAASYTSQDLRWPKGHVYYEFDASLPQPYVIAAQKAIAQYNEHRSRTGVWLFRGTNGGAETGKYVRIYPTWSGPSRVSHVGYHGRKQYMYLNQGVPPIWQVVAHEFGHVIGLSHEHQRCDRDIWLNVPDPSGAMAKECGLPTAERYNPLSIMHYANSELSAFGVTFKDPNHSAPAKSLHPGLVESDLRTIATMYRSSGAFSAVSVMHGKCLDSPARVTGTRVHMRGCDPRSANQTWTYDAASGELKLDAAKCLGVSVAQGEAPVVVADCHGGHQQKWDFGSHGGLLLRSVKDPQGRPLCAEIVHWNRNDGAELMLQYCHRSDNQQWRRHPANWGVGPSTVSLVSDVIPANVAEDRRPAKCMDAPSAATATQIHLWDCLDQYDPNHANQRFVRTTNRELRVHGKCVDGHNGQVGDPVRLWDCNNAANQRWELTGTGTLYGINGLCIQAAGGGNANGTPLRLATCTPSPSIRWWTRDPQ